MELTWLGHAAFRVRTGNTTVIMDPFGPGLGLSIPPAQTQADVVTLSSDAAHHAAVSIVTGDKPAVVFSDPGEYEAAGIQLRGIRTTRGDGAGDDDDEAEDRPPAWNTVFVVEAEGIVLCHLGDPERQLSDRQIEELGSPHVLLLPVGSPTGLSADAAVELVSSISPRIIVPMLFAHPGNKAGLRELKPFLAELGEKAPEAVSRLTVTRATLPEETKLSLLQPAASTP
ncbi:MAG: MBL fold metallo-hydrolase [Chloroflexi bacterium]|nr:MBL fold metallo-hydrolase [Chloroflexota bacterium]MCI0816537.1 MBL fold metallo-hydrolase [Chloroflexota bacterium]